MAVYFLTTAQRSGNIYQNWMLHTSKNNTTFRKKCRHNEIKVKRYSVQWLYLDSKGTNELEVQLDGDR